MVEGARLESVYRGDSIVGSNPTVSATQSAVFGSFRELSPKSGHSAAVSDPYCTKITLPESHLGAHQTIFSAAIFRGTVRGLADGAKPGERTLVIPAHRQFAATEYDDFAFDCFVFSGQIFLLRHSRHLRPLPRSRETSLKIYA